MVRSRIRVGSGSHADHPRELWRQCGGVAVLVSLHSASWWVNVRVEVKVTVRVRS